MRRRRGSALVFALWTIAVLSALAISFAYEARQQMGVNVYVQRRNTTSRLVDAGRILAETILLSYDKVADWNEDQDDDEMMENDVWYREKQSLKSEGRCTIGPVCLDRDNPENSLVTVKIGPTTGEKKGVINVNELYGTEDPKTNERWWMIFLSHNIPEELDTPEEGRINLWNVLIASWNDWRDSDDAQTQIDGKECGAENDWYEEMEDKFKDIDDDARNELRRRPRNGPIPDLKELAYVRGFRDYPQVLTGGVINPWDEHDPITVRGILDVLCTEGPSKIDINNCSSIDALVTIPGVFDDPSDEDDCYEEAQEIAQAIIDAKGVKPDRDDIDENRSEWPFKDWSDLMQRIDDIPTGSVRSSDIDAIAQNYIAFSSGDNPVFEVEITGEASGMKRTAVAKCYVKDGKVRYWAWSEN